MRVSSSCLKQDGQTEVLNWGYSVRSKSSSPLFNEDINHDHYISFKKLGHCQSSKFVLHLIKSSCSL
jgi:hypothetical protein